MPAAFRRLFATVLMFCQSADPYALWLKFYPFLSEDFSHKYGSNAHRIHQLTVRSIERYLEAMGKSLSSFGLEHLDAQVDAKLKITRDVVDALDAPIPEECLTCRSRLNNEQNAAFLCIMQYVMEGKPGAFFIDGPGGTGKTFLYNALYAEIRLMNKIVLPTATSGIAAANIPSGRTAHSRFKIPLDSDAFLACDVPKQDLLLQDVCGNQIMFGGKIVVFGGDFRQVMPVVPHKSMKEDVDSSIVTSFLWQKFIKFRLVENIRARDDLPYSRFLLSLGNGELQESESAYVQLSANIAQFSESEEDLMCHLMRTTFPEMSDEQFQGESVTYKSFDVILNDSCNVYPTEFINSLCPGGMSPHELVLKENCPFILLRNLLPSSGLCNGTRLICKRFFPNVIQCVIATGQYKGDHVFIHRINLRPSGSVNYPFQFERKKFPIKLSFAMTINKSQGQTLNQVVVHLPRPCFSQGQLYVALSRAKRAKDVTVYYVKPPDQFPLGSVKNVVAYEVLKLAGIIKTGKTSSYLGGATYKGKEAYIKNMVENLMFNVDLHEVNLTYQGISMAIMELHTVTWRVAAHSALRKTAVYQKLILYAFFHFVGNPFMTRCIDSLVTEIMLTVMHVGNGSIYKHNMSCYISIPIQLILSCIYGTLTKVITLLIEF
ncbi:uncharacterized protein LOC110731426 [Chenopodium quinoa]|uniref:uncharacterized protein LOC110731426 n=1 Tax=Chenopodium quinoa TaxID=63459 RepID=UPI000B785EE8|nr:uncharacterized protein LOC110731426 [Chenopodium quinoa]